MLSVVMTTDTARFFSALRGDEGAVRQYGARRVVAKLSCKTTSIEEAIEEFFGRDSDEPLLYCLFLFLREGYRNIVTLVGALARRETETDIAILFLREEKRKHCREVRDAFIRREDRRHHSLSVKAA